MYSSTVQCMVQKRGGPFVGIANVFKTSKAQKKNIPLSSSSASLLTENVTSVEILFSNMYQFLSVTDLFACQSSTKPVLPTLLSILKFSCRFFERFDPNCSKYVLDVQTKQICNAAKKLRFRKMRRISKHCLVITLG